MTRRMAVHFWPAFAVISRATSRTKRSNSGVPGPASGPRIAAFRLSASMVKRTEFSTIAGWLRSFRPVSAEPVKVTTSWAVDMVEQIADGAGDQLQRALGQQRRSR